MWLKKNVLIFCILLVFLKATVTVSLSCGKNELPDGIEVRNSNDIILRCSKPKSSIIQRNRHELINNQTWHLFALNYKVCASNFTSDKCDSTNGEWISGINSLNSKRLNITCCYNEEFKSAKYLKYFYVEKGQKLKVGEITKNGKSIGFEYISNLKKIINYDKSVTYKISVNAISYQKPKLQMHGITTKVEIPLGDSKKTSEAEPLNHENKEENLNTIEFGVCGNAKSNTKNKPVIEKPCSIPPSNTRHWSTVLYNRIPVSRKLYQAPLRPGSNRIVSPKSAESSSQNSDGNDSSEIIENDDFSVDFAGGIQCPFDGDINELSNVDGTGESNVETSNSNTNGNLNENTDANGNNVNSQSNSNTNSNSQNLQTTNINNQNSQSNNIQNSQPSNNNNQNPQNNAIQNPQNSIAQNSLLQSQNINPQIVQFQNPVNSFVMPMPNVPFVQNPVNPPAAAADYGQNPYAGYAAGAGEGACFTGDTEVAVFNGKTKRIDELEVDDWIYSAGKIKFGFSRIISWLHRMPKLKFEFIKITLENGKSLKITKNHYIYKTDCSVNEMSQTITKELIAAENIEISDCLLHLNNKNQLQPKRVIKIEIIFEEGIYAPLTESGNIFVNDILASCYSEIDSFSLLSIMPKLNKLFKFAVNLFQTLYFEESYSEIKKYQNEIDLIPGIKKLIEIIKFDLYPNYQKI